MQALTSEWANASEIPTPVEDSHVNGAGVVLAETQNLFILPSGDITITECAAGLFERIAPTRTLFVRSGVVVQLFDRDNGSTAFQILKPAAARSLFEKYGRPYAWRKGENNDWVLKPTICPGDTAEALLQSQEAIEKLPVVTGLSNSPILREVEGKLEVSPPGYDEQTKLYITGGSSPPEVELNVAVEYLSALFLDFNFASEGDKSRAIASLLTPALKLAGFIKGSVPADVAEADQSQSGKTYRQRVNAAVYNEKPSLVTNREGGVGSVDESLSQRLIEGRPFIQLDNFRGRLSSPNLEAFLTADGTFPCRVPYRGEVLIQTDKFFIFLSSNGVDTTRDFANRSSIIRIRKQPEDYVFWKGPEGDLLAHVRAHQAWYLGCVFAVIKAWHKAGCQRTDETRHDFKEWVQILDWIVQNIFGGAPIMEGHRHLQENVSSPGLIFLRSVALAAEQSGRLGDPLTATDIYKLCEESLIDIPGLRERAEESIAVKVIGSQFGKLFRKEDTVEVDIFRVWREEHDQQRSDGNGSFPQKFYRIEHMQTPPSPPQ